MAITPGMNLLNKYLIREPIGEGGMARVWLAEEIAFSKRPVALKEPRADLPPVDQDDVQRRFHQEVTVCAALEGAKAQHIVRTFTAEPYEGKLLLAMAYMPGKDLAQRIAAHPQGMPMDEVISIGRALLTALQAAHEHPMEIVHRDLKPSNVLFDEKGIAHLADFGLAQIAGHSGRSQLKGGAHPGSPLYMAPEQASSNGYLTPAADLFALGCILFEMVTGKRYKRHRPGTRASQIKEGAPPWLDDLLVRALVEDPFDRYESAEEMLNALASPPNIGGRQPTAATQTGQPATGSAVPRTIIPSVRNVDPAATGRVNGSREPRTVTIDVHHNYGRRNEIVQERFWVEGGVDLVKGRNTEETWRNTIAAATGKPKQVLSDLYRQLVLGNFTSVEGEKGHKATGILNRLYPDGGTLRGFYRLAKSNAAGMIVLNLMRHDLHKEEGYRLLGGIFVSLLNAGLWKDIPKLNEKP